MTRGEAVNWLINIMSDIGKIEHQDLWHYEQALSEIREMLEDASAIEPERETGRWIIEPGIGCRCSKCDFDIGNDLDFMDYVRFCPNCGARMEENGNES